MVVVVDLVEAEAVVGFEEDVAAGLAEEIEVGSAAAVAADVAGSGIKAVVVLSELPRVRHLGRAGQEEEVAAVVVVVVGALVEAAVLMGTGAVSMIEAPVGATWSRLDRGTGVSGIATVKVGIDATTTRESVNTAGTTTAMRDDDGIDQRLRRSKRYVGVSFRPFPNFIKARVRRVSFTSATVRATRSRQYCAAPHRRPSTSGVSCMPRRFSPWQKGW